MEPKPIKENTLVKGIDDHYQIKILHGEQFFFNAAIY